MGEKKKAPRRAPFGADDEIRTRDPHLGKVMLYQLSHIRMCAPHPSETGVDCNGGQDS